MASASRLAPEDGAKCVHPLGTINGVRNGRVETAGNIHLITGSFAEFLSGLRMTEGVEPPSEIGPGAQARPMAERRGRLRLEPRRGVTVVHFVDPRFIHDQECLELSDQLEAL